ncbi:MAG: endonuclease [Planctomycetaceae bacterium]|nr:endonuclease [Planctomycetaceae bacterium]
MNRPKAGQLITDLETKDNKQARQIAEIIQRVRPDMLLLNEFDFDASNRAADLFQRHYLAVGQDNQQPITFDHRFLATVNTGLPSGHDLDNDGETNGPGDAFGFGGFPGQYGMLVLSKFPIDSENVRTFQTFLWRDMPGALLPETNGKSYYVDNEIAILRLSSKSHWDLPIRIGDRTIHFLCAHPTPPVFDGPEDRNGRRNHDEIRFWADYIDPTRSDYIHDDRGRRGGLAAGSSFIIAGDMNADPFDGDSRDRAIQQLLSHALIQNVRAPTSRGAREKSVRDSGANDNHKGPADQDTSDFNDRSVGNLRLDYVLPGTSLKTSALGVLWPAQAEDGHDSADASDHRLVWLDIALPSK